MNFLFFQKIYVFLQDNTTQSLLIEWQVICAHKKKDSWIDTFIVALGGSKICAKVKENVVRPFEEKMPALLILHKRPLLLSILWQMIFENSKNPNIKLSIVGNTLLPTYKIVSCILRAYLAGLFVFLCCPPFVSRRRQQQLLDCRTYMLSVNWP